MKFKNIQHQFLVKNKSRLVKQVLLQRLAKLLLAGFITVILHACASKVTTAKAEHAIETLMVGSWVADLDDKNALPGISTYFSDGRLEYVGYQSVNCETPKVLVKATWRIQDENLIIVVQDSTNYDWYPPGMIVEDKIIEITKRRLLLENRQGALEYRTRSNTCLRK